MHEVFFVHYSTGSIGRVKASDEKDEKNFIFRRAGRRGREGLPRPAHRGGLPGAELLPGGGRTSGGWTFLSNHSHVLLLLAAEPGLRLRDLAERVDITERAVQKIVRDLEAAGVLTRVRDGRRNRYHIHHDQPLRHPVEGHRTVADLIRMVHGRRPAPSRPPT